MTDGVDRDYRFLIRTLDIASADPASIDLSMLARQATDAGFVGWCCGDGIIGVDGYRKVGDLELQTDDIGARDWAFCLVAELEADHAFPDLGRDAVADERRFLAERGIDLLSVEAALRPAHAGTAIPCASRRWSHFPVHFEAAIEYIDIPASHWDDYRQFMREKFGPVGCELVEHGDSYKVVITEVVRSYFRDPTLPDWNRIHLLTGDFRSEADGFFARTAVHVRNVIGPEYSVESALGLAAYRRKPRMSRNRLELSDRCCESGPVTFE